MGKNRKNKRANNKVLKVILIILIIIILVVGSAFGVIYYKLSKAKKVSIDIKVPEENKVVIDKYKNDEKLDIYNFAIFGLDSRRNDNSDDPRSDAIMIITLDKTRGKIKISSVIRDTYVEIPGRQGKDKITHAYHFGLMQSKEKGPELAIDTLNKNFGLDIEDYASTNFKGLIKIIDGIGGLDIEVNADDLKEFGPALPKGSKPGVYTLNGTQCLAYSRMRHTNGGDHRRAERQRIIFEKIIQKATSMNKMEVLNLIDEYLPQIETSLSSTEIIGLTTSVLGMDTKTIEKQQFPTERQGKGQYINKIYYYVSDLNEVKNSIIKYIYEDIKPSK